MPRQREKPVTVEKFSFNASGYDKDNYLHKKVFFDPYAFEFHVPILSSQAEDTLQEKIARSIARNFSGNIFHVKEIFWEGKDLKVSYSCPSPYTVLKTAVVDISEQTLSAIPSMTRESIAYQQGKLPSELRSIEDDYNSKLTKRIDKIKQTVLKNTHDATLELDQVAKPVKIDTLNREDYALIEKRLALSPNSLDYLIDSTQNQVNFERKVIEIRNQYYLSPIEEIFTAAQHEFNQATEQKRPILQKYILKSTEALQREYQQIQRNFTAKVATQLCKPIFSTLDNTSQTVTAILADCEYGNAIDFTQCIKENLLRSLHIAANKSLKDIWKSSSDPIKTFNDFFSPLFTTNNLRQIFINQKAANEFLTADLNNAQTLLLHLSSNNHVKQSLKELESTIAPVLKQNNLKTLFQPWTSTYIFTEGVIKLEESAKAACLKAGMDIHNLSATNPELKDISFEDLEPYANEIKVFQNKLLQFSERTQQLKEVCETEQKYIAILEELNERYFAAAKEFTSTELSQIKTYIKKTQEHLEEINLFIRSFAIDAAIRQEGELEPLTYDGVEDYPQKVQQIIQALENSKNIKSYASELDLLAQDLLAREEEINREAKAAPSDAREENNISAEINPEIKPENDKAQEPKIAPTNFKSNPPKLVKEQAEESFGKRHQEEISKSAAFFGIIFVMSTLAGLFLAPFTFGTSIPTAFIIGGSIAAGVTGLGVGALFGAMYGAFKDCCFGKRPKNKTAPAEDKIISQADNPAKEQKPPDNIPGSNAFVAVQTKSAVPSSPTNAKHTAVNDTKLDPKLNWKQSNALQNESVKNPATFYIEKTDAVVAREGLENFERQLAAKIQDEFFKEKNPREKKEALQDKIFCKNLIRAYGNAKEHADQVRDWGKMLIENTFPEQTTNPSFNEKYGWIISTSPKASHS